MKNLFNNQHMLSIQEDRISRQIGNKTKELHKINFISKHNLKSLKIHNKVKKKNSSVNLIEHLNNNLNLTKSNSKNKLVIIYNQFNNLEFNNNFLFISLNSNIQCLNKIKFNHQMDFKILNRRDHNNLRFLF